MVRWLAILLVASSAPALGQPVETPAAEPKVVVVAAKVKDLDADHYLWGAELVAARIKGPTTVIAGGLAAALKQVREAPGTVRGIVEVLIDVHSWDEEVRISCFDTSGHELWKDKARVNMGGSEEALARTMLERAIQKAEKRPVCGR
jgi:hypothetical protein